MSMEFPEVQLYVDGRPMVASKNNPEIIDDWPLHNSHGLNTTLTVGACWQGKKRHNKLQTDGYVCSIFFLFLFPKNRITKPDATFYAWLYGWFVNTCRTNGTR